MNLFDRLPDDIKMKIYEYDSTYRDELNKRN